VAWRTASEAVSDPSVPTTIDFTAPMIRTTGPASLPACH